MSSKLTYYISFILFLLSINVHSQNYFSGTSVLTDQYGVCAHVSRTNMDWKYIDIEYSLMNDCGITWVRTDFDRWTKTDIFAGVLQKGKSHRINVLPILNQTLTNDDEFDKYVRNMANSYSASANYWEAMNEADLLKGDKKENGKKYVEQLKKINKSIKAANTKNKVLCSGLAGISDFFYTAMDNGAYKYFDIMNIHTYASPENQVYVYKSIKTNMDKLGWEKSVWLTETGATTIYYDNFYTELLPAALKHLNIKPSKTTIGIVYGEDIPYFADYAESLFKSFKSIAYISVSELKHIDVAKMPVLLASSNEYFPAKYADAIVNYVRMGGILVCPYGLPFYYGEKKDGSFKIADGSIYNKLHIGFLNYWTDEAKKLHADADPTSFASANGFSLKYPQNMKSATGRYLQKKNLKRNDKFTPMVTASNGKFTGAVCGIYDLNSDLKGKVIVSTRMEREYNSEDLQAYWLPRSALIGFAYGIDRYFYYRLRASENDKKEREDYFGLVHNDFTLKLAFLAYKALIAMCPSGSSRPVLNVKSNIYTAQWKQPNGRYVAALWSVEKVQNVAVNVTGSYSIYDYLGSKKTVRTGKVSIGPAVTYIVSDSKTTF